jgi:hypothetical protein
MPLTTFTPGAIWPDDRGVHINAHGGGVLRHGDAWYWYGEHKIGGDAGNRAQVGVHVYVSNDLLNWRDGGVALAVSDDPKSEIARGCVIERPKVVHCAATGRFVMWFHLELIGQGYGAARSGVAVAESPTGPFTYLRSGRCSAGHWPRNVRPEQQTAESIAEARAQGADFSGGENGRTPRYNILGRDFAGGQQARDMTLFADDDGAVYHVHSAEHNSTLQIARLTPDCLSHSGEYVRAFENRWMEAPALFKRRGRYYLLASGCTGWAPNAARLAVADSIWGPWRELGNPSVGVNPQNGLGPEKTFGGQSTCVLAVPEAGPDAFIAMFDIWRPENAIDGRYVWLPVEFGSGHGVPEIAWRDEWDMSAFR